jgi:hypothetical protein
MKTALLFSRESPMSLALTTTHENGIFRGVSEILSDGQASSRIVPWTVSKA